MSADAPAKPVTTFVRLNMKTGITIARAAIESCRAKGIQSSVAVVDRDGVLQVLVRDTLAPQVSVEISRQKTYTAANFNAPTSQLSDRADTPVGRV